jgi:hypothetical protein
VARGRRPDAIANGAVWFLNLFSPDGRIAGQARMVCRLASPMLNVRCVGGVGSRRLGRRASPKKASVFFVCDTILRCNQIWSSIAPIRRLLREKKGSWKITQPLAVRRRHVITFASTDAQLVAIAENTLPIGKAKSSRAEWTENSLTGGSDCSRRFPLTWRHEHGESTGRQQDKVYGG